MGIGAFGVVLLWSGGAGMECLYVIIFFYQKLTIFPVW